MKKRIAIIQGHPDPQGSHFCNALAEAYASGARGEGHEVEIIEVARLDFGRAIQQENDEVVDSLGLVVGAELREVDAALGRIAAGTYGTCVSCGFAIEPKRLAAVPYATRCSRCASESDQHAPVA